jgi:hypothetical protein
MPLHPDERTRLEQKRRALQQEIKQQEQWNRRFDAIRYETEVFEQRGVPFRIEPDGNAVWTWVQHRFPIRTRGLCDAFIDWSHVEDHVLTTGEPQPDPEEWLRGVQTVRCLGNPEVLLTWNFDLALRMRLDDVIDNADVVIGRPEVWVVCPEHGWAAQFLPHEWDGWGWGRGREEC